MGCSIYTVSDILFYGRIKTETMRVVALSVEHIPRTLIYVIVTKHDFISFQHIKTKIKKLQINFISLAVAAVGFPYGGGKCELVIKTMTFR